MEQKGAALEQPTIQVGPETTSGDGSELESDCPSADDETQQQPNAVAQGEQVSEANETAAGNQERETLTVIPPTPIENQRLIQGNPYTHGMRKKGTGMPLVVAKIKRAWEVPNSVAKRVSIHR